MDTVRPLLRRSEEPEVVKKETRRRESGGSLNRKKMNANSYCGRHGDEFLFGGKGFGDLWRGLRRKE
ncbi:hypothetical protein QBC38DRAFT_353184 [Podospora fimiseda]|uniref:Uncharacterized protein n=1 Tax=Podospora fimiseda TaxID=252190 RepID=A0AAN7BYN3_9PEZI|nr:hypothetical protein QBC38DRAFT_353184 [Podospora fimiseda]